MVHYAMSHVCRIKSVPMICLILGLPVFGCGSESGSATTSDQSRISPEEVQKELEKISPPATAKAKSKR
jgi:hypothetical protein